MSGTVYGEVNEISPGKVVDAMHRGIATVRFTGTSGTINDVNILAASPVNSGQAKFSVNVILPRPAGATNSDADRI